MQEGKALEAHWRVRGLVQKNEVRMNHVPTGASTDFASAPRLQLRDFIRRNDGDRDRGYAEWKAAQERRVHDATSAAIRKRKSQVQYDRAELMLADWAEREGHAPPAAEGGLFDEETINHSRSAPGNIRLSRSARSPTGHFVFTHQSAVAYLEAMWKCDFFYDEDDEIWAGRPKGGVPTMR